MALLFIDGCALPGLHSRPLIPEHLNGEERDTCGDSGIRNVERRPSVGMKIDFDKINDIPVSDAIVQVTQSSGQDKGEARLQQFLAQGRTPGVNNDADNGANRQDRQKGGFHRGLDGIQESKGDARISYIRNVKETVYYLDGLIQEQTGINQPLGPAVQKKGEK
jgi:hypothetical protein